MSYSKKNSPPKITKKQKRLNNTAVIANSLAIAPGISIGTQTGIEIAKHGVANGITTASGAVATTISSAVLLAILVSLGICQTESQYTKLSAFDDTQYKVRKIHKGLFRGIGHLDNAMMLISGALFIATQLHRKLLATNIGGMGLSSSCLIGLAVTCGYKAIEAIWTSFIVSKHLMEVAKTAATQGNILTARVLSKLAAAQMALGIERAIGWSCLSAGFGVAAAISLGTLAFANPITGPALLVGLFVIGIAVLAYTFFADRHLKSETSKYLKESEQSTSTTLDVTITDIDSKSIDLHENNSNSEKNEDMDTYDHSKENTFTFKKHHENKHFLTRLMSKFYKIHEIKNDEISFNNSSKMEHK